MRRISTKKTSTVLAVAVLVAFAATPASQGAPGDIGNGAQGAKALSKAQIQDEIDRVVAEGFETPAGKSAARLAPQGIEDQIKDTVRCADFVHGGRYCLSYGWTTTPEVDVVDELTASAPATASQGRTAQASANVDETGDLSLQGIIERRAAMTPTERAAAERRELEDAARSIDKFLELERLRLSGTPAPGARALTSSTGTTSLSAAAKPGAGFPESGGILLGRVSEQTKTYYCGPTTLQMMAWNISDHGKVDQSTWASRLGTTTDGTAITDMVRVINSNNQLSDWVIKQDAAYVTLNIGNHSFTQWYNLNVNHYSTWKTPVILHPKLLKKYYPYLDDDGSGHFQLGRGWDKNSSNPNTELIKYYEPWNQQRFSPSEPYIERKQTRNARNSYRANQDHFQHNIGV